MNHFKHFALIVLSILFGVVFSCTGQNKSYQYNKRTPEEKARYFTKIMVDSISVTEFEEEALYKMNLLVGAKFDTVNSRLKSLGNSERKAAYRRIYQFRDSCMKTILPIKEFLRFQDFEREKYDRKRQKELNRMKKED